MIRRIKIKNYRSLNVDFKLDPVTVLIGRSGTGKTNFVEALRFLRQTIQSGVQFDNNTFPLTKKENTKDIVLAYEIEFDVPPLSDIFRYSLSICGNSSRGFGGQFYINNEFFYINDDLVFQHDAAQSYVVKCHFSTFQGNQKVSIARIALTQGLACYDFPGFVCTNNMDTNQTNENQGLSDYAKNYNSVFNAISKDLTKLQSWGEINQALQNLNSSVETISFNSQNENEILVTHKFGDHKISFDIAKESEGFRRFFAHLLAVYQNPPKQTLVFEEPERGIHPGAMQSLAEILKTTPEEGRGQVILTTHSPQLLDHFEPESIRAVFMENGETKIGPIEKGQIEAIKEELLLPGELLTVTDPIIAQEESGNAS